MTLVHSINFIDHFWRSKAPAVESIASRLILINIDRLAIVQPRGFDAAKTANLIDLAYQSLSFFDYTVKKTTTSMLRKKSVQNPHPDLAIQQH